MEFRCYLDRIEGEWAILLAEDGSGECWRLPRRLLPPEVREGDWLRCHLARDVQATEAAENGNAELRAWLGE